jgi:FlaA1/EpsC-like NDP-sugar epimerase
MHSPIELNSPSQPQAESIAALGFRLISPAKRRNTTGTLHGMIVAGEAFADLITISFAVMLSCYFYQSISVRPEYPARLVCAGATLFALVMVAMLDRAGAYRRGNSLLRVRETEQVLRVSAQALLVSVALSFLSGALFSQGLLSLCIGVVPLLLFVQKNFTYSLIHTLHARGVGNEKVLIYGAGCTGRRVFSALRGSPKLGLEPVAIVDDDPNKAGGALFEMAYERRHSVPIIKGPVTRDLMTACGADLAIVAIPSIGRDKFMSTVDEVLASNAKVSFVPSHGWTIEILMAFFLQLWRGPRAGWRMKPQNGFAISQYQLL